MSTIPADELVQVTPSVLAAGGTNLDLTGLILSTNTRVPISGVNQPTVSSFPDAASVGTFFGPTSAEAILAGYYFSGFVGRNKIPGAVLFAQYNQASVSAYLRGGDISALALATLQGFNATLTVTIDGVLKSASVNLAAATSFSNAAEIIANDLAIAGVPVGTVTGSIGGTATTSTTTGTVLTLGALATGELQVGDTVTANDGTNALNTTIVAQLTGTPGGSAGATFTIAGAATPGDLTSTTVTAKGKTMTVTALGTAAAVSAGDTIAGTGVTAGTYVLGQITPLIAGEATGGVGRYTINATQSGVVISETLTLDTPAVQYDSVSGAFVIYSGTTGASSTITFGSGAMATDILLTSATGAVISQGAVAATPAAYMNALVAVNRNWANFMTAFDPDVSGNTVKQAFAAWKNTQNDRFGYVPWDTDASPETSNPATSSLGYILDNNNDSGSCVLWSSDATTAATGGPALAAFVLGSAASIDFEQTGGRITFAYKAGPSLTADVTTGTAAQNLLANGYDFYGAYGAANENFIWFQNGQCTGPFAWFDSYQNQIWLNSGFQVDLLTLMGNLKSLPYTSAGNSLIHQALAPRIAQALAFGAYGPGAISSTQVAEVNAAAGADIAGTLQSQGWYLQILQATSAIRAARGSPPATFFYLDRGSVQKLNLASVAVQ